MGLVLAGLGVLVFSFSLPLTKIAVPRIRPDGCTPRAVTPPVADATIA